MCGARLAAPVADGSGATNPGGTTPSVVSVPAGVEPDNVVSLPSSSRGEVPPNPRAHEYEDIVHPTPIRGEIDAHDLTPPPTVDTNPFGDFFSDGPSAWLEDEEEELASGVRLAGSSLVVGSAAMAIAAWVVWGHAMYQGAGGAEAGGFVLLSMVAWIWYLSMPREQQHAPLLRLHAGLRDRVERRVLPIRSRTEGQLAMRRERDRYRAMRDERTRRIDSLGESAYRAFRTGTLPVELHPPAQRVLAMERQMLVQDHRIQAMERVRQGTGSVRPPDGQPGTDTAPDTP